MAWLGSETKSKSELGSAQKNFQFSGLAWAPKKLKFLSLARFGLKRFFFYFRLGLAGSENFELDPIRPILMKFDLTVKILLNFIKF